MEIKDILAKVRKIEIRTKGLTNNVFSGQYHSAFKGIGMSFSEVRNYRYGDEVRYIDWNVTAKTNEPHIKVFDEERDLTVMLLIDISNSLNFGSKNKVKKELAAEISAVVSFSAIANNDKVGAILFSDKIEKYIPPKKGKKHILRIIREIIYLEPENTKTDIGNALRYLSNVHNKRSIVFLISDFISDDYSIPLKLARKKHDIVAINIFDKIEREIPNVGLLKVVDSETGRIIEIDTSDKLFLGKYIKYSKDKKIQNDDILRKNQIDKIDIELNEDYVASLYSFFKKRTSN
ncbi:MAG: DUF58 domain-containing protein [Saprospiraceae bacterium]